MSRYWCESFYHDMRHKSQNSDTSWIFFDDNDFNLISEDHCHNIIN